MSKYRSGHEALTILDIRPFELFDLVKEGHLKPFDHTGRQLAPPDISVKLREIKDLEKKSEPLKRSFDWWFGQTPEQRRDVFKNTKNYELLHFSVENAQTDKKTYDNKIQKIEALKNALAQIEDIFSWQNYELPDDPKLVFDTLVHSLFLAKDIENIEKTNKQNSSDENRDKNRDIKQCRDAAKKYIADCKVSTGKPSISKAVSIIRSLEFGSPYTTRQIRCWITREPKIFPKDSSKKGRRINS